MLLKAAIKRYMIALSDDIRTKFIGEIVFVTCNFVDVVSKIKRPELYISCYAFSGPTHCTFTLS